MDYIKPMHEDERDILNIVFPDGTRFDVRTEISKIVCYQENGQGAAVPWLAVFIGDNIIARVPAHQVATVNYRR